MGKRGPKPGQMATRGRDAHGHFLPISQSIKSVPSDVIIASIEARFGLKTLVAKDVGLSLSTIVNYGQELEDVKLAFWGQTERVLDMAEMSLYAAVQKGEAWAVCFLLKTKGKGRGYIERVEQDGRFAGLLLNATVGAGSKGAQRGDFDTEGYIELFRGFFDRSVDGIPATNGAHESLDTSNANT